MINSALLRGEIYSRFKSQKAFAVAIGWHPNKVSGMLNGRYLPDLHEAAQIKIALELTDRKFIAIFLPLQSPYGESRVSIH